ncbi:MAG: IMPACT family protein [Clostridiales Family XIII bacterium]|jgi:uncharacterized YigZ family protein|nr:IMPACT family protein [Clostridiales Family XIII bacterium]
MIRYRTVGAAAEAEKVIEKSRFIGYARPVSAREEAEAFFDEIRKLRRNADHNVPAFVIGEKSELQWACDDGEPQGTAGAPIVQMLVREGITNTAVMVTRYFGGVKLGAGGLVRAYTGTAKLAVSEAGVCLAKELLLLCVKMDYSFLGKLRNLAGEGIFRIGGIVYEDKITVELAVEPEQEEDTKALLSGLTSGKCELISARAELVKEIEISV